MILTHLTPGYAADMTVRFGSRSKPLPAQSPPVSAQSLATLMKKHSMIRFFVDLVRVPSPSIIPGHPQEAQMRQNLDTVRKITAKAFKALGVPEKNMDTDPHGTLVIRVPSSGRYANRKPLMLMAHTDIVPGSVKEPLRPIRPRLTWEPGPGGPKAFISTDGTTTLGGDDKAGIAIIWDALRRLKSDNQPHVPLEIVLTPDEEVDNRAITLMDTRRLHAKGAIIVDHTEPFSVITGCAGFVDVRIGIKGLKGGHSSQDDGEIRLSATDILTELKQQLGNGPVAYHPQFPKIPMLSKNIYTMEIEQKPSNAIPTAGRLALSMRSLRKKLQEQELGRIRKVIKTIEKKYRAAEPGLSLTLDIIEELPPFPERNRTALAKAAQQTAQRLGFAKPHIGPSAGATQANLMVLKSNASGQRFSPIVILGPNNPDAHALTERVEVDSMLQTSQWLAALIAETSKSQP